MCIPNLLAPFFCRIMYASIICSLVSPYFASSGFPIMSFPFLKAPGLYLKQIKSGIPACFSRNSIWLISSRFIIAPSDLAFLNSSAGVSFELNIISSPLNPIFSAISSSANELQSTPNPSCFIIFRIKGLGVALTAKNCLKPGRMPKDFIKFRALLLIPCSS